MVKTLTYKDILVAICLTRICFTCRLHVEINPKCYLQSSTIKTNRKAEFQEDISWIYFRKYHNLSISSAVI